MLNVLWTAFLCIAFVCGAVTSRLSGEVSAALPRRGCRCDYAGDQYHRADVLLERCDGAAAGFRIDRYYRAVLMPVLRPLFGSASQDKQAMEAVSANVTANLLGLSNAATPLGLRASERLYVLPAAIRRTRMLTLIVLNATSIQLIPSTVAAVRAACGAHAPFDIMLPVWGASPSLRFAAQHSSAFQMGIAGQFSALQG